MKGWQAKGRGVKRKEEGCAKDRREVGRSEKTERESKFVDILILEDAFECPTRYATVESRPGRASYLSVTGINHYQV